MVEKPNQCRKLFIEPTMPIRLSQAVGLEKHSLLGFFGH